MKFVQIAVSETEVGGTLYALADDGTLWMMINPWQATAMWKELPIPYAPEEENE